MFIFRSLIAWFRADVDLTKNFLWKSAIYHSIKLPFDAQVDKRFLNVIYYLFRFTYFFQKRNNTLEAILSIRRTKLSKTLSKCFGLFWNPNRSCWSRSRHSLEPTILIATIRIHDTEMHNNISIEWKSFTTVIKLGYSFCP